MSMPPSPSPNQNYLDPQATGHPGLPINETPQQPPSTQATARPSRVHMIRAFWGLIMVAVLAITFFANTPTKPDVSPAWDILTAAANSSRDINEANTQGAPQQMVVAGWHAADFLEIQIKQLSALEEYAIYESEIASRDHKLLALLVLTIAGDLVLQALAARRSAAK